MAHPCCVQFCKNIGTHHFPKEETQRTRWIQAIRVKPGLTIRKNSLICSSHFRPTDFAVTCVSDRARKIIKKNAVPSIFAWNQQQDEVSQDLVFDPSKVQTTYSRGVHSIVSGWDATEGQFPYQLSLRLVTTTGSIEGCAGSIIHPEWGMTAAHCTARRTTVIVRAGAVSMSQPELIFETSEWYNHPMYSDAIASIVQPHDISLLKFGRILTFSERIQPVRLQRAVDMNLDYHDVRMVASGWGRTWTNGVDPDNLEWVYLRGDSNLYCESVYGNSIVQPSTICASAYSLSSQSTCQSDSGGPLTILEKDGKVTMVGVTSFVSGLDCYAPRPAGFIRPGHYHEWFTLVTGINFDWEFAPEVEVPGSNEAGGEDNGHGGEDKGPGSEDNGHGSEDNGPGSEDNGHGGEDNGPGSEDNGHGGEDNGPGSEDNEHGGEDNGPGSEDNGHSGEDNGPGSEDNELGGEDNGPGSEDNGHGGEDNGPGSEDNGHSGEDNGPGSEDNEHGGEDNGPGSEDNGHGGEDNGPGSEDNELGGEDNGPGSEDNGHGGEDNGPGSEDNGQGGEDNGPGSEDNEHGGEDNGPGSEDNGHGGEDNGPGSEDNGHSGENNGHSGEDIGHSGEDNGHSGESSEDKSSSSGSSSSESNESDEKRKAEEKVLVANAVI